MEQPDHAMRAGTIGGTLLVMIIQVNAEELLKTVVLAALGASVSFGVTLVWKQVVRWMKKRWKW
jgi:hypothetical protein